MLLAFNATEAPAAISIEGPAEPTPAWFSTPGTRADATVIAPDPRTGEPREVRGTVYRYADGRVTVSADDHGSHYFISLDPETGGDSRCAGCDCRPGGRWAPFPCDGV